MSKFVIKLITGEAEVERERGKDLVTLRFGTHWASIHEESSGGVTLIFNDSDTLDNWIELLGRSKRRFDANEFNRPASVIRRAMQGTFRDQEARVEAILRDLVEAGHLDVENLKDVER
jgi:hypothetical protein